MAFTRNAGVFLLKGMKQTPKINGNMFQFENKQQGRDMVTLQEVKARIKSVGNIKKITATMKLVATSKLKNAENRMNKEARPFLEAVQGLPEIKEVTEQVKKTAGQEDKPAEHHKIIPITSDRGLCGSVNNSVIRLARTLLRDDKSEKISMSLIGSKGKAGLQREFSELIDFAAFDMGDKKGIRYSDVSPIAEAVAVSDADKVSLVSNTYESLLSFNTEIIPVATPSQLASANLDKYEFESGDKADTMRNFYEWYIGALLYARAIENAATEMSARMTSMDNATRNAGDMIKKLEIQYNRGRQAAITTELTEIISGAEAVAAPED